MSVCNVNIGTGAVYHLASDFFYPGRIPFEFIRDYDSTRSAKSEFGHRWRHNHCDRIVLEGRLATYVSAEGRENEIPHPDFRIPKDHSFTVTARREGDSIVLEDLKGYRLRFRSSDLMLASQADPCGNELTYSYGPGRALRSIRDTAGRRVDFSADHRGHIIRIEMSMPLTDKRRHSIAEFQYDELGDLRSVRDQDGNTTQFRYSGHLLVEHINPIGGKTYFEYDAKQRCIHTFREGMRNQRRMVRDDATNSVEVFDSRGAMWQYRFNKQMKPLEEVDPAGNRKVYHYDDQGDLLFTEGESDAPRISIYFADQRELVNQVGSVTTLINYDEKLRVSKQTNALGGKTTREYDERSNQVKLTDAMGATWNFEYEQDGWLSAAIDPRGHRFTRLRTKPLEMEFRDEIGHNATLHFNAFGLVEKTVDGAGHETKLEYAGAGHLVRIQYADTSRYGFQYNALGNVVQVQPEAGPATLFEYDRFGAPTAVVDPLGHRSSFRYDSEGNLIEVRNPKGEVAAFQYDLMNLLRGVVSFDGRTEMYTRDLRGRIIQVEDENSKVQLTVERDSLGRIKRKLFPDGWEVEMAWGDHNELLMIRNPDAVVKFEWRPDLRVAAEHVNDFSVSYDYDQVGNRTRLSTSHGREIEYVWDARNRLVRIVDRGQWEHRFTYYEDNLFKEWITPAVVQSFAFDERHRMIRRTVTRSAERAPIVERTFKYDARGRLTAMRDQERGSFEYRYSEQGAILEVVRSAGGYRELYSYDPNQNCTVTADGDEIRYGRGNRMTQAGTRTFEYNARGAIARIRENSLEWQLRYDPEGQLRSVFLPGGVTVEYRYDPFGRRIWKSVGGDIINYYWDRGVCLEETHTAGQSSEYLFLPDTFLPIALSAAKERFAFILDQAGTPTELVDERGIIAWAASSRAFGRTEVGPQYRLSNPIRFQGHHFDSETGFHYNLCRYYDPTCARYLSQDPLGLDPQANVYRYVLNPFGEVDPYGLATLVNGILTIVPICGWSEEQEKEARKKQDAMNSKIGKGIKIPDKPVPRCGKSAKEIYEDCQTKVNKPNKPPVLPNLNESTDKCFNQQADHMLEICAGGGEEDCSNLQPLNESVNKSFGSQVGSIVRENPGAVIKKVQLHETECTERPSVNC